MAPEQDEDTTVYKVVLNHEEQYSIWPADRENPDGWRDDGKQGLKAECLAHIRDVWTDMRPLSLRKRMAEAAASPPPPEPPPEPAGPSLVERLSTGEHAIEFRSRPETTLAALRARLDQGFVHVRFTDTRGGTELGFRVDREASDISKADFDAGRGEIRLAGTLTLDFVRVQCVANLDLQTLKGNGHLRPL